MHVFNLRRIVDVYTKIVLLAGVHFIVCHSDVFIRWGTIIVVMPYRQLEEGCWCSLACSFPP
jgi:hypothetical protein